jgi:hypothetical protein
MYVIRVYLAYTASGYEYHRLQHNGKQLTHDTTMTLWHASTGTELRLATADAVATAAKMVHLAARYMGWLESGRGLDAATLATKLSAELELDTSG